MAEFGSLVLSRKLSEGITLKDKTGKVLVRISVVKLKRECVRLCVQADKEIVIHRDEIWEQLDKEKGGII